MFFVCFVVAWMCCLIVFLNQLVGSLYADNGVGEVDPVYNCSGTGVGMSICYTYSKGQFILRVIYRAMRCIIKFR